MPPTTGATPRNAPPQVATTFPPRAKRRNSGRQWPSIAAPPASTPARWPTKSVASSAGAKPFATSSAITGAPRLAPYVRQTLVAPMLPLPTVRMSTRLNRRTSQ